MSPSALFPSKVSTTQLSYVPSLTHSTSKVPITQLVLCPLYSLLNQRSAPLNCPMSPSTPSYLKCQHHSTVFCPRHPFSIKGQHNSTVICLSLTPSQCKISTTQLSYVPLRPLLPQMSAPLNCHMSPLSLLLPQRSASPNWYMPISKPFSMQDQHHSIVICPPLPPSQLNQGLPPLKYHMHPSTPFSIKGQHHSTVRHPDIYPLLPQRSASLNCHVPPLPPSQLKVNTNQLSYVPPSPSSPSKISTTQLSYVPSLPHYTSKVPITQLVLCPLYPLLNQRSGPLNCPMSPSTPFSLKCQHHSTVFCPRHPFSIKGQHNSTVIFPPPPSFPSKSSNTQLS